MFGDEALVKFRIDRFRRHEHDRRLVRFPGDQVFLRDVLHMLENVAAQPALRLPHVVVGARRLQCIEGFEWKFCIDDEPELAFRKPHDAVGPRAVAQRALKIIGALVQPVPDDGLHAALSERPARLLVGEDVLQAHHVA
jgi:hypothetical protein